MIVPMKKIFLILQKKDVKASLESLRDIGVVHIEHQQDLKGSHLSEVRHDREILIRAIDILKAEGDGADFKDLSPDTPGIDKAKEIIDTVSKIKALNESVLKKQAFIHQWSPWGDFNPQDLESLISQGYFVALCEVPVKEAGQLPKAAFIETISESFGIRRCLVISKEKIDLPFKSLPLPEKRLSTVEKERGEALSQIQAAKDQIKKDAEYIPSLQASLEDVSAKVMLEEAAVGLGDFEELAVLKGFCPEGACKKLLQKAQKEHWGLVIQDPEEEDNVPTLLRTPKWVALIKPLLDFVGILPGYKEMDISPFFLVFFSFFVAVLIGDAGYGLIYLAVFGGMHFAMRKKIKNALFFKLVYLLCACIILWGLFAGTFFGQQWISNSFHPLIPWVVDPKNLQTLCFLAGAIQLTVAHCWRIILIYPSLIFLSEIGWIALVWIMFFAARMFIVDVPFPHYAIPLLFIGPALIYLFSNVTKLSKYIQTVLGKAFPNTLDMIGVFSDIVSYIRLYAVGLATVAIADAANLMAWYWIIILHFINILLAALAILVHALRLNTLEFSRHLGLEWKGFPYKPFRKIEKVN